MAGPGRGRDGIWHLALARGSAGPAPGAAAGTGLVPLGGTRNIFCEQDLHKVSGTRVSSFAFLSSELNVKCFGFFDFPVCVSVGVCHVSVTELQHRVPEQGGVLSIFILFRSHLDQVSPPGLSLLAAPAGKGGGEGGPCVLWGTRNWKINSV